MSSLSSLSSLSSPSSPPLIPALDLKIIGVGSIPELKATPRTREALALGSARLDSARDRIRELKARLPGMTGITELSRIEKPPDQPTSPDQPWTFHLTNGPHQLTSREFWMFPALGWNEKHLWDRVGQMKIEKYSYPQLQLMWEVEKRGYFTQVEIGKADLVEALQEMRVSLNIPPIRALRGVPIPYSILKTRKTQSLEIVDTDAQVIAEKCTFRESEEYLNRRHHWMWSWSHVDRVAREAGAGSHWWTDGTFFVARSVSTLKKLTSSEREALRKSGVTKVPTKLPVHFRLGERYGTYWPLVSRQELEVNEKRDYSASTMCPIVVMDSNGYPMTCPRVPKFW